MIVEFMRHLVLVTFYTTHHDCPVASLLTPCREMEIEVVLKNDDAVFRTTGKLEQGTKVIDYLIELFEKEHISGLFSCSSDNMFDFNQCVDDAKKEIKEFVEMCDKTKGRDICQS